MDGSDWVWFCEKGVTVDIAGIAPDVFIAVFYTGLGLALALAGVVFGIFFLKCRNKTSYDVEEEILDK